jgi:DNA repair exonuclease SbcCD ATPase subunit
MQLKGHLSFLFKTLTVVFLFSIPAFANWQIDARDFYEWLCSKHISQACNHQGRYSYLGNYKTKLECENARYSSCGGGGDTACMNRSRCVGQDEEEGSISTEENKKAQEDQEFAKMKMEIEDGLNHYQNSSEEFRNRVAQERHDGNFSQGGAESSHLKKTNPILKKEERENIKRSIQNAYCAALAAIKSARAELLQNSFAGLDTGMEGVRDSAATGFDKPQVDCPDLEIPVPPLRTSPEFEKINVIDKRIENINKELNEIIPVIKNNVTTRRQIETRLKEKEKEIKEVKETKKIKGKADKNEAQKDEAGLDELLKESEGLRAEAEKQKEISERLAQKIDNIESELKLIPSGVTK